MVEYWYNVQPGVVRNSRPARPLRSWSPDHVLVERSSRHFTKPALGPVGDSLDDLQ
jgi:hypothetical protein